VLPIHAQWLIEKTFPRKFTINGFLKWSKIGPILALVRKEQKVLENIRNIGISAHIDAGKTTLSERILFYTKRIHTIHEVKGKDGVGAKMDSMELEKERGITISSAATHCEWKGYTINLIDTPGHVDFTIEVERALRVLDGIVLVLCAVGGVQSQTITIDRQMRRYEVPCIAFINKCDRVGADYLRVLSELRTRLGRNPILMQIPIGIGPELTGVVDLVTMKANYFKGKAGETVEEGPIPEEMLEVAHKKREELLDQASMFSDELMEAIFEDKVEPELIYQALRMGTIRREALPTFIGSAYKNVGVQPLLDGITRLLPSPSDVLNTANDLVTGTEVELRPDPSLPFVGYAFKLQITPYGQLTYLRTYQGSLKKGDELLIQRSKKEIRVGRIVKLHADEMEDVECCGPGDIVALFGVDCYSGDTLTHPHLSLQLGSIHVPEPVVSLSIQAKDQKAQIALSKALNRFAKEDPTFRSYVDQETRETIISGMGELHLEIYIERIKREYSVEVTTGYPQVAYREAISRGAPFDYTHKKQTGGAGQYGRVIGVIEPSERGEFEFENQVKGGNIPSEFIPAVEKGFRLCLEKGPLLGFPVMGVKVILQDGQAHSVDSSELAFVQAAQGAFRQAYPKAGPVILEPIMKVTVESPSEFQGLVMGSLSQRRGIILSSMESGTHTVIEAEVPLSEMFGYANVLRSLTQGKAQFQMIFQRYALLPEGLMAKLVAERQKEKAKKG